MLQSESPPVCLIEINPSIDSLAGENREWKNRQIAGLHAAPTLIV
jgi:hypothetical protein